VSSPSPNYDNFLQSVVCLTATNCWTVGYGDIGPGNDDLPLVEQ